MEIRFKLDATAPHLPLLIRIIKGFDYERSQYPIERSNDFHNEQLINYTRSVFSLVDEVST